MARLSLCHISLKSRKLLILDEINNNIDMITKLHVVNILKEYNGAMIIKTLLIKLV
jgi:ATPase subunit of ABC transporter with duplicated ATPase domains